MTATAAGVPLAAAVAAVAADAVGVDVPIDVPLAAVVDDMAMGVSRSNR